MTILTRHLAREIYGSVALVFTALIALFAFMDLIQEMNDVGQGQYSLGYVALFVVLAVPEHIYELFPLAVLLGTILALVQMAANSELMVYRVSGASVLKLLTTLSAIALPLALLSFVVGELVAPPSEQLAQQFRFKLQNTQISVKGFRSGVWAKDEHSFVNIKNMMPDTSLNDINIYRFDKTYHLENITYARRASFLRTGVWQLEGVQETRFNKNGIVINKNRAQQWNSALTPEILSVLLVVPEQMSASNLYQYILHLRENRQQSARYEIAMWNKLIYPLAILVMMILALPFAGYQRRAGGIGAQVFMGIVLGLVFHFMGKLFASLGALNNWPPSLSASAMTGLFLLLGITMLWWTERR